MREGTKKALSVLPTDGSAGVLQLLMGSVCLWNRGSPKSHNFTESMRRAAGAGQVSGFPTLPQ